MANDTRAALLDAAISLFSSHGYGAVPLSVVARRANLTTGAVYSQFESKPDLLAASLRHVSGEGSVRGRIDRSIPLVIDALSVARSEATIRKVLRAYFGLLMNQLVQEGLNPVAARRELHRLLGRAIAREVRNA